MTAHVVVTGGGFAGAATALSLMDRGLQVTLCERRAVLGGRAWSFPSPEGGEIVDNGQHLFAGAYRETLDLLGRLGTREHVVFQPAFEVPLRDLRRQRDIVLRRDVRSLLRFPAIVRVALALRGMGPPPDDDVSVEDWLTRCGQSSEVKSTLWWPLAIAVLNQDPRVASSGMMAAVLREAGGLPPGSLGGVPDGARLGNSRVPLSDLLAPLRVSSLRLSAEVAEVRVQGGRAVGVTLRDGHLIEADAVVLALPPRAAARLHPPLAETADRLGSSAIVSVHLWFDRPVVQAAMLGLVGSPIHWIFRGQGARHRVSMVTSAADALADREADEIVALARAELARALPESRDARLVGSQVIKEREATISHAVGTSRYRPDVDTSIPGLFLAGDWLATGLPATLEGAVRAGRRAAALCAAYARGVAVAASPRARSPAVRSRPART